MRSADTNVLVRLITRDDPRQAVAADTFIEAGAWVSLLALTETLWVLDSSYGLTAQELALVVEGLLDHKSLVLQDADIVAAALGVFRAKPALGFTDCLLLEISRKVGHLPLGTFDRNLGKLDGAEKL